MVIALTIFLMSIFWMLTITTSIFPIDPQDVQHAAAGKANYAGLFPVSLDV
jgi:hypothetical protein